MEKSMNTNESARELYRAGKLTRAIEVQNAEVRAHPTDPAARSFLIDLLCFEGNWERADQQLDVLGKQDPRSHVGIALARQLVRAAQWRQQFFHEGRLPEFVQPPSARVQLHLRASVLIREGKPAEGAELLGQAEASRPKLRGTADGGTFEDFRDMDDLTASVIEVLTSTGKYYWIPFERVRSIELKKPLHARDVLWRRATVVVADGPEGEVYLPTLYPLETPAEDEALRLGRATDWIDVSGEPVRGRGQRMFLVGDEARALSELHQLSFDERS